VNEGQKAKIMVQKGGFLLIEKQGDENFCAIF